MLGGTITSVNVAKNTTIIIIINVVIITWPY